MIYKRCPKCGKRILPGTVCQECKREYRKPEGIYKQYHTQAWKKMRERTISKYDGLDLWALYHKQIIFAETVHHIIPSSDAADKFFSADNLIPVSRQSHDEIHSLYKTQKMETQQLLYSILEQYARGVK